MSAIQAFERLAERGTARGSDDVLRVARAASTTADDPGRRWPVRIVLVGVAAVFVLVVAVALRGGSEDSQPVDTGPGPGYLFGEPTDVLAELLAQDRALDLDTGVAQQYDDIAVRPREIFLQSIDRIGGQVVYQGDDGPIAMPLDLSGEPRLVAQSFFYRASGYPDRLWLVQRDDTVSEVTISGETTVPSTQLPLFGSNRSTGRSSGTPSAGRRSTCPTPRRWRPVAQPS